MLQSSAIKMITKNRKAYFEYEILERLECGIELKGTEVKSIRNGRVNLKEGFASIDDGELFLKQVHISPYEQGNVFNVDPVRKRKLLVHKKEIRNLIGVTAQKGLTLIPLSMYFKNGNVKVSIGVARGKSLHDKRQSIAKRDVERNLRKELKNYQ